MKQARTADERAKVKYESDYKTKVENLKASFNKQVDAVSEKRLKDKQEQIDSFGERFAEWVQS